MDLNRPIVGAVIPIPQEKEAPAPTTTITPFRDFRTGSPRDVVAIHYSIYANALLNTTGGKRTDLTRVMQRYFRDQMEVMDFRDPRVVTHGVLVYARVSNPAVVPSAKFFNSAVFAKLEERGHDFVCTGNSSQGNQGVLLNPLRQVWRVESAHVLTGTAQLTDMEAFLYHRADVFCASFSSNVHSFYYDNDSDQLVVTYMGKKGKTKKGNIHHQYLRQYVYDGVSPETAMELAQAARKGIWIWDEIRVRGKGNSRKSNYSYSEMTLLK